MSKQVLNRGTLTTFQSAASQLPGCLFFKDHVMISVRAAHICPAEPVGFNHTQINTCL